MVVFIGCVVRLVVSLLMVVCVMVGFIFVISGMFCVFGWVRFIWFSMFSVCLV